MPKTESAKENDVAYALAQNVAGVNYKDLPPEVVEVTKMSVLDTLGVIVAASGTVPGIPEMVELAKETGGREESTIVGFGGRVPAWMAAFVNAAMGHALDYDDLHHGAMVHPSSPAVTAGFAVAERVGNVTGSDFIAAVALGNDLACRLGLSVPLKGTWHPTTVFGVFGAAAISGKLLGLDEEKMVNALGLAYHQCGGAGSGVGDGALAKRMGPGLAAKAGITAALMAERGIRRCSRSASSSLSSFTSREKYAHHAKIIPKVSIFSQYDIWEEKLFAEFLGYDPFQVSEHGLGHFCCFVFSL